MNVWHPQAPAARSSTAPFTSLCAAPCWLSLMLPALLLKGQRPVNPCSSSSRNSGFHIWPCSWRKSPNLVVSHKKAIPHFWSSSFVFMNQLYWSSCISFERRGRNCTVLKIWVHNGMCSKDILYLLTPQIQIAFLTSSEYCRSRNYL